jgi:peptidoglycan/LPS O-acetylase OafA/YrhL
MPRQAKFCTAAALGAVAPHAINYTEIFRHKIIRTMSQSRLPLIDAVKGLGCVAIVLHHLAFYGPMSDVVHTAAPNLIDWLFNYARLAVQVFLVLAGYLVAAQIAPGGQIADIPWRALVWKRYKRLITPFLFAVAITILITAIVRPWFQHASLSAAPGLWQLLAHALLLHDLLGMEALSAGVWYVAIDLQLFAATLSLTALAAYAPQSCRTAFPILIVALVAASLWGINRDDAYDDYAPYFFGAYGLGMLSYWSSHSASGKLLLACIVFLSLTALWLQYRDSVAVVFAMALLLSLAGQKKSLKGWPCSAALIWLGHRSYSIFLIHFGICVAFNAVWHVLFPLGILINTVGILAAAATSIAAGSVLFKLVENKRNVLAYNIATMALVVTVAATMMLEASTGQVP